MHRAPGRACTRSISCAALFGILVVNLPYYGLPIEVADGVPRLGDGPGLLAWGVVKVLFESKFFSLFSWLFGISLVLQRESLLARGDHWIAPILRRQGFLLIVGLVHGVFLFHLDILLPYAILGTIALIAFALPTRANVAIAVCLLALSILLSARGELKEIMRVRRAPTGIAAIEEPHTLEDLVPNEGRSLASVEGRVFRQGPPWAALVVRGYEYAFWLYLSTMFSGFNARVLALMLIGIVFMRAGGLDDRWRVVRRTLGLTGWLVGLPLELMSTALLAIDPERGAMPRMALAVVHDVGSLALSVAFAMTLVAWGQSAVAVRLQAWLASAGRMAFTTYLSQSIAANLVFTGVGLGWYGELTRVELLSCALLLYAAQVAASAIWLAHFTMGPLEWIWRSVTHLRRPVFRLRPGIAPG